MNSCIILGRHGYFKYEHDVIAFIVFPGSWV